MHGRLWRISQTGRWNLRYHLELWISVMGIAGVLALISSAYAGPFAWSMWLYSLVCGMVTALWWFLVYLVSAVCLQKDKPMTGKSLLIWRLSQIVYTTLYVAGSVSLVSMVEIVGDDAVLSAYVTMIVSAVGFVATAYLGRKLCIDFLSAE